MNCSPFLPKLLGTFLVRFVAVPKRRKSSENQWGTNQAKSHAVPKRRKNSENQWGTNQAKPLTVPNSRKSCKNQWGTNQTKAALCPIANNRAIIHGSYYKKYDKITEDM